MAPLALVANLATRWRHLHLLQIWPPDGTTCISCNLTTRWRHLYKLHIWPPSGTTWIGSTFGHPYDVSSIFRTFWSPLASVAYLATKWHNLQWSPHCLEMPYWHYQFRGACRKNFGLSWDLVPTIGGWGV